MSDFITEANSSECYQQAGDCLRVPYLLSEASSIQESIEDDTFDPKLVAKFLHDAQEEKKKLDAWPSSNDLEAVQSIELPQQPILAEPATYPQRIDIYRSITEASLYNKHRLVRIHLLSSIVTITRSAQAQPSMQPHISRLLLTQLNAETAIKSLVDDICASVPYFMQPQATASLQEFFPHRPEEARMSLDVTLEQIPALSQMIPILQGVCDEEYIPNSAKQWLSQYTSILSRSSTQGRIRT